MNIKKSIIGAGILGGVLLLAFLYYALSPLFTTVTLDESAPESALASEQSEQLMKKALVVGTPLHAATGTVSVVDTKDGKVLRYENFKTINGPDLFVYLSSDEKATDFVDLGALKATEGNVNYSVPKDVDLAKYPYVLVWCKQFGVLFNSAHIGSDSMDVDKTASSTELMKDDVPKKETMKTETKSTTATALFANGCFWCVEHDLDKVTGVLNVVSGYAGGTTENPTYQNYHAGGYREVVEVTYNPQIVSYGNLVEHIIKHGDPTDATGSFFDRGSYYAPAIYFKSVGEKEIAKKIILAVDALNVFDAPLPLVVLPAVKFWPAEEYHQDYSSKNPLKYSYYRSGSGRTKFFEKAWGAEASTFTISNGLTKSVVETKTMETKSAPQFTKNSWDNYVKPSTEELKKLLTAEQFDVTQKEGTEAPRSHAYDRNTEVGIYVDIVSGEPLYFSKDKYDSGTGWPSFVKPISLDVVKLVIDKKLFSTRTEVRSRYADSHVGHVFEDGPKDRGGKRYCMNGAALRFISKDDMEKKGYAYLLSEV